MWCSFIRKGKYCLLGSWNSKPQKEESLGRNTDHYGCSSSSFIFQLLQLHSAFWLLTNFSKTSIINFSSVQFSRSVCPTLCDPMNRSMPGLPVHHQLPESTQTHVHRVGDAIQPSHPLLSPSPPALNLSQHQGLFKWVSSSHQVAKVLEFQLQYQFFQWTPRTDLL